MKQVLSWLLVLALTINVVGVAHAQPESPRAHPALLQLAQERPNEKIRVIVQRKAWEQLPEQALQRAGGKVMRELPIINGFAMELPARAVAALAKSKGVRWISLDAPMFSTQLSNETVRDEFASISYGGNNGTQSWSGDWQELGESDGPSSGRVRIYFHSRCATGNCLRMGGDEVNLSNRGVMRTADLSGAASATFSFSYRRYESDDEGGSVRVQVSGDGGANWTTLSTYHLSGSDSSQIAQSFDITSYIAANTQIRFLGSGGEVEGYFYFDNIEIEYTASSNNGSGGGTHTPETVTLIPENSSWHYLDNGSDQGTAWRTDNFDDSSWGAGPAQLGYGDSDEATVVSYGPSSSSKYVTTYFRHPFYVSNAGGFSSLTMRAMRDDGIVAYLNGTEVYRNNMPSGAVAYNTYASSAVSGADESAYYTTAIDPALLVNGDNVLAVEIHQANGSSSDISFNLELTGETTCADCISVENLASTYVEVVNGEQLWNEPTPVNGEDIVVAVVDSGINHHKDFKENGSSRLIASVNFSTDEDEDDGNGHGTHVAGIIAGNGRASHGQRIGIAPKAKLVSVKVTNEDGMGYVSDVVAGLQWIYENKDVYNIRVVNISVNSAFAESYHTSPLSAAVEILWFNGIVVVVAAGNNGSDTGPVTLYPPANDPFVITVGATNDLWTPELNDDFVETFSAYGTTEDGFAKPDLVAPGRNIISLLASIFAKLFGIHPVHQVDEEHFRMSGTSMTAPIVSGAVALLLQDEPNLTPDQVKYRLMATANQSWPGYDAAKAGAGYVDVAAAVHGTTTENANTGIAASAMLFTGDDPVAWDSVSWNSVSWNSVSWNSVSWNSVSWNSETWTSGIWDDESEGVGAASVEEPAQPDDAISAPEQKEQVNVLYLPIVQR